MEIKRPTTTCSAIMIENTKERRIEGRGSISNGVGGGGRLLTDEG